MDGLTCSPHVFFCLCQGADIDTLLVAPRHVDRSDFFSSFIEVLLKEKVVSNVRVSVKSQGECGEYQMIGCQLI